MKFKFLLTAFFFLNVLYAVWTYTQTDPNLVISSWPPFWSFQQWAWALPDHLVTQVYVGLVSLLFVVWYFLAREVGKRGLGFAQQISLMCLVALPLLFSNNALSHDVFNYMFNAKMVVKYQVDPHVRVAQDFYWEPWLRFMHNVHTPAPYFYGWTAMSVVPYVLGFEKFIVTWFLFRLWSMVGWVFAIGMVGLILKKLNRVSSASSFHFALLAFNPLVLIEIISNAHNDGWMMGFALASLVLLFMKVKGKANVFLLITSLLLLLISISTKYVTVVLLPVWGYLAIQSFSPVVTRTLSFLRPWQKKVGVSIWDFSAIILFLPLLTARSQYFHPWYLVWCLSFLPLLKNKFLRVGLLALSLSSLYRYLPWLWYGGFEYTSEIQLWQKEITWVLGIVLFLVYSIGIFLFLKSNSRYKKAGNFKN